MNWGTSLTDIALAAVALISLGVTIWIGCRTVKSARRSADADETMAETAKKTLVAAQEQFEETSAMQLETIKLAQEQLANTIRAQEDAKQPYVWADIRPLEHGDLLYFVLANHGQTVATDINVKIEPPLTDIVPEGAELDNVARVQSRLESGISSLPPGKTLSWSLGRSWDLYTDAEDFDDTRELSITVDSTGPYGAVETVTYKISFGDLKHQSGRAYGFGAVSKRLDSINSNLKALNAIARSLESDN